MRVWHGEQFIVELPYEAPATPHALTVADVLERVLPRPQWNARGAVFTAGHVVVSVR